MVTPQGLEVSSSTLPSDIELQAHLSSELGRQPVYEIRIPLEKMERHGKAIRTLFVSTDVSPEVKTELLSAKSGKSESSVSASSGTSSSGHGGGRHGHGGGASGSASGSSVQIPRPMNLPITIDLVKPPKQ